MYYEINRFGRDEPNVDALARYRVPKGHRPEMVDPTYPSYEQTLATLGFQQSAWYLLDDQQRSERAYLVTLLHQSGVAVARVWRRAAVGPDTAGEPAQITFLSSLADGTFLLSTGQFSDLAAPPATATNQLVGASAEELWESHVRKLAANPANQPVPIPDGDHAAVALEQYHQRVRDDYLEHGVFQTVNEQNAVPIAAAVPADGAVGDTAAYAPILAEIDRLQDKKPGWGNALWILGFSLVVFFGAGAAVWSWHLVLLVVPILLFHELGHYVAMRIFGYRNLRMFFIPLFGAAVSGRHYNVPGWKKAIVSLAGPLPGIAVGIVLSVVSLFVGQQWLVEASLMMLFLNGFNLLPFLPLDGGWVAHAILFSRNPALDAGFRVVAAVALIAGGLALDTYLLPFVGLGMLFGVPMAFRIARVAVKIRRENVAADASGDRIPPAAACRIINELRAAMPAGMTPKQIAQTTVQVFENANARPPGWLASLGFGVVHAGSFLVLLVPVMLLIVQQQGGFDLFGDPAEMPRHPLTVHQIRVVEPVDAASNDSEARTTVLATFPTAEAASDACDANAESLPAGGRLMLFGQTLIIDLPQGDSVAATGYADQFRLDQAQVFVSARPFDSWCGVDCMAPSEEVAQQIADQAQRYFGIPAAMYAIPPWSPDYELTDRQTLARATFQQLNNGPDLDDDATLLRLSEQLDQAYDADDDALIDQLDTEYTRRETEMSAEFRRQLRQSGDEQADVALIDTFEAMPEYQDVSELPEDEAKAKSEAYTRSIREWQLVVGAHLGQLPLVDGQPEPGSQRYSTGGFAHREGSQVIFQNLPFLQMYDGPRALVQWLDDWGCTDIHYGFLGSDQQD